MWQERYRAVDSVNEAVEDILFGQYLNEGINDQSIFKAVMMAGGPGSGKSFIVNNMIGKTGPVSGLGAIVVNSDDIFEKKLSNMGLPKVFDKKNIVQYAKQMDARQSAKDLSDKRLGKFLDGMLPVVIDGTGKDYPKIKRQADALTGMGYDVSMVFVNTSLEVALERNEMRARKVAPDEVKKMWDAVQQNMGKFQTLFGQENFRIVDNSKSLEGAGLDKVKNDLFKMGKKLLAKGVKNPIGQNAIEAMKYYKVKNLSELEDAVMKDMKDMKARA